MRRAGYNPTQNEVLDIINRFTLRPSKQNGKKVSAKKIEVKLLYMSSSYKRIEHLMQKLRYLWRLDVEKEVDSLDILGDLDFKVKHPLLEMFQIGKYIFGKFIFLLQEFVAIMKEVAESSASPEVGYKRGTKDRKIANKLFLNLWLCDGPWQFNLPQMDYREAFRVFAKNSDGRIPLEEMR